MTEVILDNGVKVLLYSSIKELPMALSKKFNNYLLQDAGIGNTIESVDEHYSKVQQFIAADKKAEAQEEMKNLRFNLFSMLSEWDFNSMAFGCLVKSVDGAAVTDHTSEGLAALINQLSDVGLTVGKVQDVLDNVKKNWIPNVTFTSQSSLQPI